MFIYTSACAKCGEVKTRNKKKKKNQSLHLKREREREKECAMTFPKEGKSQLRLGEHYPVVGEHVHEKKK